ncbi:uncharacterized protein LOC143694378 [Agelaius phoeniceus]|uniref:uncharacterized protein LOC143694378 n=1 Tax=Agelaius phoeniceus TaxID=39638 RepID=UPI004054B8D4
MAVPLFHTGMSVPLYLGYLLCTVNPLFLPSGLHFCPGSLPAFRLSTPGSFGGGVVERDEVGMAVEAKCRSDTAVPREECAQNRRAGHLGRTAFCSSWQAVVTSKNRRYHILPFAKKNRRASCNCPTHLGKPLARSTPR